MGLLANVKLLLKLKTVWDEFQKVKKEGLLKPTLQVIWHAVLLTLPAIGGFAAKAISDAFVSSHTPLLVAVGTVIGTLLPWLAQPPTSSPTATSKS